MKKQMINSKVQEAILVIVILAAIVTVVLLFL